MIMEGVPVWQALTGGVLIGLAAVLLMLGSGRIAGISGILAGVYQGPARDRAWRVAFLAGLAAGGLVAAFTGFAAGAERADYPVFLLFAAGLAAGFGARLGNGCTSGHGVCGISRLSTRSLVATALFTATGMMTVALLRAAGVVP